MAGSIRNVVRKALRTAQSAFPGLRGAKQEFYYYYRKLTAHPHDADFRALALFNKAAPGTYVDVGANHGQSIESIRLFRPAAQIVAFEPNPLLAAKLSRTYRARPGVEIRPVGLADANGEMTLFVPSYRGFVYDGLASLDRGEAMDWINADRVYFFDAAKLAAQEFNCRISTLDNERLEPAFMKIDVQGFEYNALRGGVETLRRCEPIVLIENFNGDRRSVELMTGLGYKEYHFDGKTVVPGASLGANSFLITDNRARAEGL